MQDNNEEETKGTAWYWLYRIFDSLFGLLCIIAIAGCVYHS